MNSEDYLMLAIDTAGFAGINYLYSSKMKSKHPTLINIMIYALADYLSKSESITLVNINNGLIGDAVETSLYYFAIDTALDTLIYDPKDFKNATYDNFSQASLGIISKFIIDFTKKKIIKN